MGFRVAAVAIVIVCLLPVHALGQDKAPTAMPTPPAAEKTEAKLHFDRATIHYNLDEWPQAIQEFRAAYHIFPDPSFLYNIAQCQRKLGNLPEALSFYKNFLRERPDAPNRTEVEKRIAELQTALVAQSKAQEHAAPVPVPPPNHLATGPAAAAPGANSLVSGQSAAPSTLPATGATTTLTGAIPPVQGSAAATPSWADLTAATPTVERGASNGSILHKWWFWTAAGTAVVAGAVLVALTSSSKSPSPYQGNLNPPVLSVP